MAPLDEVATGEAVRVVEIEGHGPQRERLLDLGFVPGTEVVPRRRAPLGDPRVYELRGLRLCLRRSEAHCIRVERRLADENLG